MLGRRQGGKFEQLTCNVSSLSVVLLEVEFDRQFYENEFQIKLKP